jgi:hypothetical protein
MDRLKDHRREKLDEAIEFIDGLIKTNDKLRCENAVLSEMVTDNKIGFKCACCEEWFDIEEKCEFGDVSYCPDCAEEAKREHGEDPDPNYDYEWAKHTGGA